MLTLEQRKKKEPNKRRWRPKWQGCGLHNNSGGSCHLLPLACSADSTNTSHLRELTVWERTLDELVLCLSPYSRCQACCLTNGEPLMLIE